MSVLTRNRVRFGPFELDTQTGELSKLGYRLNLHGQPIEVLSILLERPGELITREDLCKRLWPQDTFVDFEHSLNTAIKKLRQTLDDDPDNPRYIETLPKKGYRFIAQVEPVANGADPIAKTPNDPSKTVTNLTHAEPTSPRKWSYWLLTAAITLLLVLVAGTLYWVYRPRTPVVIGVHQLTRTGHRKSSSYNIHQVATDGTRLYFNDWSAAGDSVLRLAQISIKGGEVSYLDIPAVRNPELVGSNADGSQLLVIDEFSAPIDGPIWLASLPNGPQRKISSMAVAFGALVPGGSQLIYSQPTNLNQLSITDVSGGNPRLLINAPNEIFVFSVSPDSKQIRFEMAGEIWEALLDGTGLHRFLPQYTGGMCCGAWNQNGTIYSFARGEEGVNNLWAVTETGWFGRPRVSIPVQLTYGPISLSTPTFSKDGRHIYALGLVQRGELAVYDKAKGEFKSYLGGLSAAYLDFSPDGQWVAYVTYPQRALWRSRVDGTERLQLTFPPMGSIISPKWSPDGRLIAFTEWGVVDKKVYVVPANGGDPLLLLSGSFNPSDPTWSPDGKSIAYSGVSMVDGPGTEVRILNLDTQQSRTIPGSQHMFSSRWSPDGRNIAALSDDTNRLFVYSFDTGRWQELLSPEKGIYPGWPSWSRDSHYLYVASGSIYKVRVPDGYAEVVASTTGIEITCPQFHSNWFGLTPDERVIVMRDRGTDELYALDLEYR